MIFLRKHRFWSRSAASVHCDQPSCSKSGPADFVIQPTGGFAIKFSRPGLWFVTGDSENMGAPFRTFCLEHRPETKRVQEASPAQAAEVKRLLDVSSQKIVRNGLRK